MQGEARRTDGGIAGPPGGKTSAPPGYAPYGAQTGSLPGFRTLRTAREGGDVLVLDTSVDPIGAFIPIVTPTPVASRLSNVKPDGGLSPLTSASQSSVRSVAPDGSFTSVMGIPHGTYQFPGVMTEPGASLWDTSKRRTPGGQPVAAECVYIGSL